MKVFDHISNPGKRIDEETIEQIHSYVGKKIGNKFYIIAPSRVFDFQQDYIDLDGVRYYAMRIPYSFINELHRRAFTALEQPKDERAINETVDAVGFDFIQPPEVAYTVSVKRREGQLMKEAFLKIKTFRSRARLRSEDIFGDLETLSMLMLDYDFKKEEGQEEEVFDMDAVFYGNELEANNWQAFFPHEGIGEKMMAVFIDIHGNEARRVISREEFGIEKLATPRQNGKSNGKTNSKSNGRRKK